MTYQIENKPVPNFGQGRRINPISATMRKLKVGQSFVIERTDSAWTGTQVRNENMRRQGKFVAIRETPDLIRIGRVA